MSAAPSRRETRSRKVSQRMAVVDDSTRQRAAQSRLEALEQDNADDAPDPYGLLPGDDDEEFLVADDDADDEEVEVGRKRKRKSGAKRKTRGALADGRAPKSFQRLLEESGLLDAPPGGVNYLSAAAAPSAAYAPRKFCSVCGFLSSYTCARCGSKYCCRKCYTVHTETRCLKFMA
ncbi:SWC6 [Scenedesmus sp. PABB004]|nr:SWC6 [Scenedesmus sp. PABB004]